MENDAPRDYSVVGCRLKFNFITMLMNYSMFHCFDEIKEMQLRNPIFDVIFILRIQKNNKMERA